MSKGWTEDITNGVLIITPDENYLVIDAYIVGVDGAIYTYMLMKQHDFVSAGLFKTVQEIEEKFDIIDVVLATVEQSGSY